MSQKVDYGVFQRTKRSVEGRLARLRKVRRSSWLNKYDRKSPIQEIGVFEDEIVSMETTLKSMQARLRNAKVTVKL